MFMPPIRRTTQSQTQRCVLLSQHHFLHAVLQQLAEEDFSAVIHLGAMVCLLT